MVAQNRGCVISRATIARMKTASGNESSTALLRGLPPIAGDDARVLILGSFPSEASLRARRYYDHPRNQFWRIIDSLFAIARADPYPRRCAQLVARGVAVWDVIGRCRRKGSMDSAIRAPEANDFARFYRRHPRITAVFFNGGAAEQHYRALVGPPPMGVRLPSTSPANARLSFADKTAQWAALRDALRRAG